MAEKRIIELANEKLLLSDGDMTIVDSENGTYKYDLNRLAKKTITDATLSVEGKPADAKAVGDALAEVSVDTANNARQLLSESYTLDQEPYHFRASGGDGADRVEECIVGGTVGWNQLVQNGNFVDTSEWGAGYATLTVANNVATLAPTNTTNSANITQSKVIYTHKYLAIADVYNGDSSGSVQFQLRDGTAVRIVASTSVTGAWTRIAGIYNVTSGNDSGYFRLLYPVASSTSVEYKAKNVMLIDLTTLFGSTIADYIFSLEQSTAGAGVAWFRKLFPNDFYEYSAPTLKNVEGVSAKQVTGWNQWDEEWELGAFNDSGLPSSSTSSIRSKNYVPVHPNNAYYFHTSGVDAYVMIVYYDESFEKIAYVHGSGGGIHDGTVFTPPEGTRYLRFGMGSAYGTTYNHDICISLSDPTKNGTYEPYHKNIYPLDSTLTLRGIPKLTDGKVWFDGDKYNADGTVERRYGIVDLGTLTWNKSGDSPQGGFLAVASVPKRAGSTNVLCAKYETSDVSNPRDIPNQMVGRSSANSNIYIRDDSYSDAATFKTAMSGVYLVYEKATPTTESATPYTALQTLDLNGTEEFVSTGIVPVGHYSKYIENLRSKIEGLPRDFSTLIAPTEAMYKATRNYTTGDLLIVNNILYKATANIANGGTITVGTNVTATTLAAVIAALA